MAIIRWHEFRKKRGAHHLSSYLTEIVKSNMDALYRTKLHTIEIVNKLPEELNVYADGLYVENVIRNLVENALKYSDDGVAVNVILSVADNMLQVSVHDNGWGIAKVLRRSHFVENFFFRFSIFVIQIWQVSPKFRIMPLLEHLCVFHSPAPSAFYSPLIENVSAEISH